MEEIQVCRDIYIYLITTELHTHTHIVSNVSKLQRNEELSPDVSDQLHLPYILQVRVRDDFMPLCHVAMAVETCGWKDPDNIPLLIANMAVGNWDRSMMGGKDLASRLAVKFVSNPAAHSFMSFNTSYSDTGLW